MLTSEKMKLVFVERNIADWPLVNVLCGRYALCVCVFAYAFSWRCFHAYFICWDHVVIISDFFDDDNVMSSQTKRQRKYSIQLMINTYHSTHHKNATYIYSWVILLSCSAMFHLQITYKTYCIPRDAHVFILREFFFCLFFSLSHLIVRWLQWPREMTLHRTINSEQNGSEEKRMMMTDRHMRNKQSDTMTALYSLSKIQNQWMLCMVAMDRGHNMYAEMTSCCIRQKE